MDDPIYQEILELYNGRCVLCNCPYDCFHEIIPKSRTKFWKRVDNIVLLCAKCHWEVHRVGASKYRDKFLNIYASSKKS